jgi:hypothetical protein
MTDIDECSTNPCKNAGVCTDGIASYSCACKGAWTGATCQDVAGSLAETNATCHEESFVDLALWLPDPNPSYSDPTLTITCNGTNMTVSSNAIPQYDIEPEPYAQELLETPSTYSIPLNTVFNMTVKQSTVVGGVGVAVNGMQISSPSASGGPLRFGDPTYIEADGDACMGHANPSGKYHYHALMPSCLFPGAEDGEMMGQACTAPSPPIGWLYDGYPILGPCECLDAACTNVVEMHSSYVLAGGDGDPSDCAYQDYTYMGDADEHSDDDDMLDECNGHIGPNGDYHYHMTNEYPWTTRCYRGTPNVGMNGGQLYDATDPAPKPDANFELHCVNGSYI